MEDQMKIQTGFCRDTWLKILTNSDLKKKYTSRLSHINEQIGAFIEFAPDFRKTDTRRPGPGNTNAENSACESTGKKSITCGLPFGVKDNIAVKGMKLTCASKMLENVTAPYTATAVSRLQQKGALVAGKTNLDEFGMGSSTDNSALLKTANPWKADFTAGGSSGGSAAAVAAGMVPFAIGSDTGGSIRQPASFCGVYGLKPTYGTVSRYGLVAYASSLESIGIIAPDIELLKEAFTIMRGFDPMDQTTIPDLEKLYSSAVTAPENLIAKGRIAATEHASTSSETNIIGILPDLPGLSPEVAHAYNNTIKGLTDLGFQIVELDMPTIHYVVPAYYTIASAEASANLARYTGIRYGRRTEWAQNAQELVEKSRDEALGQEVKLRILLGTYVLRSGFQDQYYLKAQKIRTAIRNDFAVMFKQCHLLLLPVYPVGPFRHGSEELDQFQQKMADIFTAAANLAGIPALAFPSALDRELGLPLGMQFLAPHLHEQRLFKAAKSYSQVYAPKTQDILTEILADADAPGPSTNILKRGESDV